MPDTSNLRYQAAEYRIRLFLSVDLSGSTAFKNSALGEARKEGATPAWVTEFQDFYSDFPSRFASVFQQTRNQSSGNDACPKLWKAVGDELIFCGRVQTEQACVIALNAFIKTLIAFRQKLQDSGLRLNVKGAAWLGAFPEPNRTVRLRKWETGQELFPTSEALELAADKEPFDFDFLGKAIDTGFRVASKATPEKFVLSVQLARLLVSKPSELGFGHQVRLERPATLKGVNKDEPYPVLYIDTMEHLPSQSIKKLEREILKENEAPSSEKLLDYLKAYCELVGTDEIMLRLDSSCDEVSVPESYLKHKEKIQNHLQAETSREFDGNETLGADSDEAGAELDESNLSPIGRDEDVAEKGL